MENLEDIDNIEDIENFIIKADNDQQEQLGDKRLNCLSTSQAQGDKKQQEFNDIYKQLKKSDIQTLTDIIKSLTTCLTESLKTNNGQNLNNTQPNNIIDYQQEKHNFIFSVIKQKIKRFFKNCVYLSNCIEYEKYSQFDQFLNNYIKDIIDFYYSTNLQNDQKIYFNKNGFYSTEFLNIFSEYINILDYNDIKKMLLETFETLTNKTLSLLNDFDSFLSTEYYSC